VSSIAPRPPPVAPGLHVHGVDDVTFALHACVTAHQPSSTETDDDRAVVRRVVSGVRAVLRVRSVLGRGGVEVRAIPERQKAAGRAVRVLVLQLRQVNYIRRRDAVIRCNGGRREVP